MTHILVVFLQRYHALALFYCYHNQTAQAMEVWKKYALTLYQNILEEKKGFHYWFPVKYFWEDNIARSVTAKDTVACECCPLLCYLFNFFSFAYETNKACLNKPGLTNSSTPASQNAMLQETDSQRKLLRPRLIVSRKTDSTGYHGKRILSMKPHAPRRTEEGKWESYFLL